VLYTAPHLFFPKTFLLVQTSIPKILCSRPHLLRCAHQTPPPSPYVSPFANPSSPLPPLLPPLLKRFTLNLSLQPTLILPFFLPKSLSHPTPPPTPSAWGRSAPTEPYAGFTFSSSRPSPSPYSEVGAHYWARAASNSFRTPPPRHPTPTIHLRPANDWLPAGPSREIRLLILIFVSLLFHPQPPLVLRTRVYRLVFAADNTHPPQPNDNKIYCKESFPAPKRISRLATTFARSEPCFKSFALFPR